jgi:hypothetical protein
VRRPLRNAIAVLVVAALAPECVYLVAANVFLNSSRAPAAINRRPPMFEIRWRSAWTLWPGMVILRDVETRGRSRRVQWYAHLDSVDARFHVAPLFRRQVRLTSVQAAGVVYRQRRTPAPGQTLLFAETDLPSIPDSLGTPAVRGGTARPVGHKGPLWTVDADRIDCAVRELWFDRYRLSGLLRVTTGMSLVPRGPMAFPGIHAVMTSGDLTAGKATIFARLGLDVDATIDPFVGRTIHRLGFFKYLSGTIAARSDDASLFFLEPYFRKTPWIRFKDRGAGRVVLNLDHGRLRQGSTLDVRNDHVDMELLDRHLTGKMVITGRIETAGGALQSHISGLLTDFQLAPLGSTTPYARGERLTIDAMSRAMDLSNPFSDTRVVVDLPRADLLDLKFYNFLFPRATKFRFLSGTGWLRYHFEGSHESRSLQGDIDFVVDKGVAAYEDQKMYGGFTLRARLKGASPEEQRYDISGTSLAVRGDQPPWTALITLPRAHMRASQPPAIRTRVRLKMQDTRPLVALFDALHGAPHWVLRMLTIEDIHGVADLDLHGGTLAATDIEVTGQGLRALAELTFGDKTSEAILYARLHGFSLGIARNPSGRQIKIVRPLHWFEQQRALSHGDPGPE